LQSPQVNQRLLLGPDIISNDISNDRLKSENSLGQKNTINYILHYNVINYYACNFPSLKVKAR